jgi:hypothetical protein
MFQLMAGWIQALAHLFQWGSSQYRTAKSINEKLSMSLVAKNESFDIPDDDGLGKKGFHPPLGRSYSDHLPFRKNQG